MHKTGGDFTVERHPSVTSAGQITRALDQIKAIFYRPQKFCDILRVVFIVSGHEYRRGITVRFGILQDLSRPEPGTPGDRVCNHFNRKRLLEFIDRAVR